MPGELTHRELCQRIGSSFPHTLVVPRQPIRQESFEADAKDGFRTCGKLFTKYQRGALSASVKLCLNRSKLCSRRCDDEGRMAKVQLGRNIEGYDISRFQDVEAGNT